MSTSTEDKKTARARLRTERQAARAQRRAQRGRLDALAPKPTPAPDDRERSSPTTAGAQLRRRRAFALIEASSTELVAVREAAALRLFGAAPGTDAHSELTREVEALNDELDDLRELSDELLRQVGPLALADDRLSELERMMATARALSTASLRAQALLEAARDLLGALDEALG